MLDLHRENIMNFNSGILYKTQEATPYKLRPTYHMVGVGALVGKGDRPLTSTNGVQPHGPCLHRL